MCTILSQKREMNENLSNNYALEMVYLDIFK